VHIKQLETYPLLYPIPVPYGDANGLKKYRSAYLIRIITESGIDGWGECVDWLPLLDAGFKQRIIPYLRGKNALKQTEIVRTVSKWHGRAAAAVSNGT
jgi:D-galactarolactone cycloisomerase